jgi:hypothetical protein
MGMTSGTIGELDGGDLRAGEDQHAVEVLGLEDPRQGVELVHAADDTVALADVRRRAGLAPDRDLDRRAQVLPTTCASRLRLISCGV